MRDADLASRSAIPIPEPDGTPTANPLRGPGEGACRTVGPVAVGPRGSGRAAPAGAVAATRPSAVGVASRGRVTLTS